MNGENVVEYHLWTDQWKEMVADSKFKDWPNLLILLKKAISDFRTMVMMYGSGILK